MQRAEQIGGLIGKLIKQGETAVMNLLDVRSEDVESLLAPGVIERLVRDGRIPRRNGRISIGGGEMQPYYQIPPAGYPEDVVKLIKLSGGVCSFKYKDGSQRIGPTFTLTKEQALQLEERVKVAVALQNQN